MLWIEGKQDDWNLIGQYSNVQQQHRSKAPAAKTDTISIEDVRSLQGRLHETGSSPHLCCLIRGIDRMQPTAANAFLKMLEEPPPRVRFVLTAESEHAVLPTIASRTRILRFYPVPSADMKSLLEGSEENDAAFALHLSQGAPGALRSLLQDPDLLRAKRQIHAQAKQFWQTSSLSARKLTSASSSCTSVSRFGRTPRPKGEAIS
jgi:DNA polymerase-3 subunit delta'